MASDLLCSLLIYPNPESALNEEAGRLLLEQVFVGCASNGTLLTSPSAGNIKILPALRL